MIVFFFVFLLFGVLVVDYVVFVVCFVVGDVLVCCIVLFEFVDFEVFEFVLLFVVVLCDDLFVDVCSEVVCVFDVWE